MAETLLFLLPASYRHGPWGALRSCTLLALHLGGGECIDSEQRDDLPELFIFNPRHSTVPRLVGPDKTQSATWLIAWPRSASGLMIGTRAKITTQIVANTPFSLDRKCHGFRNVQEKQRRTLDIHSRLECVIGTKEVAARPRLCLQGKVVDKIDKPPKKMRRTLQPQRQVVHAAGRRRAFRGAFAARHTQCANHVQTRYSRTSVLVSNNVALVTDVNAI